MYCLSRRPKRDYASAETTAYNRDGEIPQLQAHGLENIYTPTPIKCTCQNYDIVQLIANRNVWSCLCSNHKGPNLEVKR